MVDFTSVRHSLSSVDYALSLRKVITFHSAVVYDNHWMDVRHPKGVGETPWVRGRRRTAETTPSVDEGETSQKEPAKRGGESVHGSLGRGSGTPSNNSHWWSVVPCFRSGRTSSCPTYCRKGSTSRSLLNSGSLFTKLTDKRVRTVPTNYLSWYELRTLSCID